MCFSFLWPSQKTNIFLILFKFCRTTCFGLLPWSHLPMDWSMITNLLESKLTFTNNSTNSWGRCREELVQTGERGKVSSITYSLLPWSPKIVNEKMTTKTTDAFLNWEKVKVSNSLMQKSKACLVSGALWANPSNLLFSNRDSSTTCPRPTYCNTMHIFLLPRLS